MERGGGIGAVEPPPIMAIDTLSSRSALTKGKEEKVEKKMWRRHLGELSVAAAANQVFGRERMRRVSCSSG